MVTEDLALAALERNQRNRRLRRDHLHRMIKAHRAGHLLRTTDAIGFDVRGWLQNGQHRLTAIQRTGIPLLLRMEFGMPIEAGNATDLGAKRTCGDTLDRHGYPQGRNLAASVQWAKRISDGIKASSINTSFLPDETMDLLAEYPGMLDSLTAVRAFARRFKQPQSVLAAAHWHLSQKSSPALADEFLAVTMDCLGADGETDPRYLLNKRLQADMSMRRRMPIDDLLFLMFKAWDKYIEGARCTNCGACSSEPFPEIRRVPVAKGAR
jgi:hypothetical protein